MLLLLLCPHLPLIRTTHTVCAENVTCTRHCSYGGRDHTDGKTLGPRAATLHVLIRSPFPASSHALYSVPYMVDLSNWTNRFSCLWILVRIDQWGALARDWRAGMRLGNLSPWLHLLGVDEGQVPPSAESRGSLWTGSQDLCLLPRTSGVKGFLVVTTPWVSAHPLTCSYICV